MKINERPINPKVSVWTKDWFPKKGDELKQMYLYTVMKQCERISSSAEKGKSGSIFPYLSDEVNPYTLVFDGVVFVDIDNCQEVSYKIFDSFDKICDEMPNLPQEAPEEPKLEEITQEEEKAGDIPEAAPEVC